MRIDHLAIYVNDLEGAVGFFEAYFGARAGAGYHNPRTGLRTNFLDFDDGSRLELMARPGLDDPEKDPMRTGYTHMALSLGSRKAVDALAERLRADGYEVLSGPRVTGDGYYEASILGFEGNNIEIMA